MSASIYAILAYGYNLGEYDDLPTPDWYNPEDGKGFEAAAERKLLAEIGGFTEAWTPADGYSDRKDAATAKVGVRFETHGSDGDPMLLLTTKAITVYQESVKGIDPAALVVPPEWDTRLRTALDTLGINPTQETARWLLCSYWG